MKISREKLLEKLESITAGIAKREIVEQSGCFVFTKTRALSFNDEVACSIKTPLKGIEGAIKAEPLLAILRKLGEKEVDVSSNGQELLVRGNRRRTKIKCEQEVQLQWDIVDMPKTWSEMPEEFAEAVSLVRSCASRDESQFSLTCIHVHPDYLEACDNWQAARYRINTGIESDYLVRASSLAHIAQMPLTHIGHTEEWLHFRNDEGLVLSCRRWIEEEYKPLDRIINLKGKKKVELPKRLAESVDKCTIFSSEEEKGGLLVDLRPGEARLIGEGPSGSHEERPKIDYKGEPLKFLIDPKLFLALLSRSSDAKLASSALVVDAEALRYVVFMEVAEEE